MKRGLTWAIRLSRYGMSMNNCFYLNCERKLSSGWCFSGSRISFVFAVQESSPAHDALSPIRSRKSWLPRSAYKYLCVSIGRSEHSCTTRWRLRTPVARNSQIATRKLRSSRIWRRQFGPEPNGSSQDSDRQRHVSVTVNISRGFPFISFAPPPPTLLSLMLRRLVPFLL